MPGTIVNGSTTLLTPPPCTSKGLLEALGKISDPGAWDKAVKETRLSPDGSRFRLTP